MGSEVMTFLICQLIVQGLSFILLEFDIVFHSLFIHNYLVKFLIIFSLSIILSSSVKIFIVYLNVF
jgi:hypothetical protein